MGDRNGENDLKRRSPPFTRIQKRWGNDWCGAVDRRLVVHELVHVMQYERFGGIETFLKEYVQEVVFDPGYPHGPLEEEESGWPMASLRIHRNSASDCLSASKSDPGSVQPRSLRDFHANPNRLNQQYQTAQVSSLFKGW
jgi:hypothetical protein